MKNIVKIMAFMAVMLCGDAYGFISLSGKKDLSPDELRSFAQYFNMKPNVSKRKILNAFISYQKALKKYYHNEMKSGTNPYFSKRMYEDLKKGADKEISAARFLRRQETYRFLKNICPRPRSMVLLTAILGVGLAANEIVDNLRDDDWDN